MEEEHKRKMEELIGELKCPKDFRCYQLGFDNLCRAKDIGIESFLVCLEENQRNCKFAVPVKTSYLCHCPLRIYIAKKLKK